VYAGNGAQMRNQPSEEPVDAGELPRSGQSVNLMDSPFSRDYAEAGERFRAGATAITLDSRR
jgi:hypothetical protein